MSEPDFRALMESTIARSDGGVFESSQSDANVDADAGDFSIVDDSCVVVMIGEVLVRYLDRLVLVDTWKAVVVVVLLME